MPEKGQIDELQLERAVHLQIISDLRAQLQQVPPFVLLGMPTFFLHASS